MTITVIGKLADTKEYEGRDGFNVLASTDNWSKELNHGFIESAIKRGDHLLFTSWTATGQYREELIQIINHLLGN